MLKDKLKWFNRIFKKFGKDFKEVLPCTFHNLIWQILINGTRKGKSDVFYPVIKPEGTEMVIAHSTGGYMETGVMFKSNNWDKCQELCEKISLLSPERGEPISVPFDVMVDARKRSMKALGWSVLVIVVIGIVITLTLM